MGVGAEWVRWGLESAAIGTLEVAKRDYSGVGPGSPAGGFGWSSDVGPPTEKDSQVLASGPDLRFCISHLDLFRGVQLRAGSQTEQGMSYLLRGTVSILVSWKNVCVKLVGLILTL